MTIQSQLKEKMRLARTGQVIQSTWMLSTTMQQTLATHRGHVLRE
jgi:hypothetical protein